MPTKLNMSGERETKAKNTFEFTNYLLERFAKEHNIPETNFHKVAVEKHPLAKAAVRKFIVLDKLYQKFYSDVKDCLHNLRFGMSNGNYTSWNHPKWHLKCIFVWIPDKDKRAIAFPTLCLPIDSSSRSGYYGFADESPYFPSASALLIDNITADLECPRKSQSWTPLRRGIRTLGMRNAMSLTRILARCLLINDRAPDAHLIDNLAAKMYSLYEPMEYRVANTVEEVRKAYIKGVNSPASCMDSTHSFGLTDSNPVDFYGHCPTTKVAYVVRGDEVLARTIIYQNPSTQTWFYNRVYANRDVYKDELVDHMKKQGIKYTSDGSAFNNYSDNVIFTIPEDTHTNGSVVMPFPYFDLLPSNNLWCKHKSKEKHFKVVLTGSLRASLVESWNNANYIRPSHQSTSGYAMHGEPTDVYECMNCGYDYDGEDPAVWIGNNHYCCNECAEEAGYGFYVQSNNYEWRDIADFVTLESRDSIMCYNQHALLSNLHAGVVNPNIGFYYPCIWADTEVPLPILNELNLNLRRVTNVIFQNDQGADFATPTAVYLRTHDYQNIAFSSPLFRKYERDIQTYQDLNNNSYLNLSDYSSYFFEKEGETMLRIIRPTIRIHERKRVSLDSIPKVIKDWSLSVIEGNTDFDDNIFNAMFDYNYKDEVIGKPLQGVNIINKL